MKAPQNKNTIAWLLAASVVIAVIVIYLAAFHERPLYFRVVFGKEGTNSMLVMLDKTSVIGRGYDVAYVDENMNGDLTDDGVKKFHRFDPGELYQVFEFEGPLKEGTNAKYRLIIRSLARKTRAGPGDYHFSWRLDTEEWAYFFMTGKMRLFSSAADALKGPPVRLAGDCKWQISSAPKDGKTMVSAGLKDENGCTLGSVTQARKALSPRLSLLKDDKVELEEDMKFG